jgi:alanyl-tRNA synthetase
MIDTNQQRGNYYIIADHLRTTIFALGDEALFAPKGRGYILKKLVKKATLLGHLLNLSSQQLQKISEKLIEVNSVYYPHLKDKEKIIINELKREIDKFREFISKSLQKLDKYYTPEITAKDIFFWYDTKGIPLELIQSYLKKQKHPFPASEFNQLLAEQKKRSSTDRENKNVSTF